MNVRHLMTFALVTCALAPSLRAQASSQGIDAEGTIEFQPLSGRFTARPAAEFIDSIGTSTHFGRFRTHYVTRFAELKPLLLDLGIRHIRTDPVIDPVAVKNLRELGAAGIRFIVSAHPDRWGVPDGDAAAGLAPELLVTDNSNSAFIPAFLAHVKANYLDATEVIEGLNEPDPHSPHARQWIDQLRRTGRADPAFAHVAFLGSAVANPRKNAASAGDWSEFVDLANVHAYPGGYSPESSLSEFLEALKSQYHDRPIYITETGYHNALKNPPQRHRPAGLEAEGIYMPRLFLEYFRRGIARSYDYQLLDDRTEEEAIKKYGIPVLQEAHFGMIDYEMRPKPSYHAVKNLIALLNDKPGVKVASPRTVHYSLKGPNDLRHVLLQKSSGELYLAVWRAVTIWDPVARQNVPVESVAVTLTLDAPLKSARLFRPSRSPECFATVDNTREIPLTLEGDVVILRLEMR